MADLKVELREDKGHSCPRHQLRDALVPGGIPLEAAVQGGNNVGRQVGRGLYVVLVQTRRLKGILNLNRKIVFL